MGNGHISCITKIQNLITSLIIYHPKHAFRGIVKSQIERFDRICNNKQDFDEACTFLFNALKPQDILKKSKDIFYMHQPVFLGHVNTPSVKRVSIF